MSSPSAVADEQIKVDVKDEKKKKKKSVKLSEGKSKSSSITKSSSAAEKNGEDLHGGLNGADKESEEKFSAGNSQDDSSEKKENDPGNSVDKNSGLKNSVITLRELDFRKLAELKEAFHLFDINRDGYIDREDLRFTFTSMGKPDVSEEALDQMLTEMSSNAVDFDTFVKLFGYKAVELDPAEELLAALRNWDYMGNGMISEERLKRDLQAWGDKFSATEAERALEEAPVYKKDGTTMIDYVKFCDEICALRNIEKTRQIEKEAEAYEKDIRSFVK